MVGIIHFIALGFHSSGTPGVACFALHGRILRVEGTCEEEWPGRGKDLPLEAGAG